MLYLSGLNKTGKQQIQKEVHWFTYRRNRHLKGYYSAEGRLLLQGCQLKLNLFKNKIYFPCLHDLLDSSMSTFPVCYSKLQECTDISRTFYIINNSIINIFTCLFLIVNKDHLFLNVLDAWFCFSESSTRGKNKWVAMKINKAIFFLNPRKSYKLQ